MFNRKYKQDSWAQAALHSINEHKRRVREAIAAEGLDPDRSQWDLLRENPVVMGKIIERDMAGEFGDQFPRATYNNEKR